MLEHQMALQKRGGEKAQGIYVPLAVLANIQMTNILITPAYGCVLIFFFKYGNRKYRFAHRILIKCIDELDFTREKNLRDYLLQPSF